MIGNTKNQVILSKQLPALKPIRNFHPDNRLGAIYKIGDSIYYFNYYL